MRNPHVRHPPGGPAFASPMTRGLKLVDRFGPFVDLFACIRFPDDEGTETPKTVRVNDNPESSLHSLPR